MQWLSHTHPASAALASAMVHGWWGYDTCLCLAHPSSVSLYAWKPVFASPSHGDESTMDPSLVHVHTMAIPARILGLNVIAQGDAETLCILTDHPSPCLMVLAADPQRVGVVHTKHVWSLEAAHRPPAELGLGLYTEPAHILNNTSRWAMTHLYTGHLQLVPLSSTSRPALAIKLEHPELIHSVFLERMHVNEPPMIALLSISSEAATSGMPLVTFHTLDARREALIQVSWTSSSASPHPRSSKRRKERKGDEPTHVPIPTDEAFGAQYLVAMPAQAGGGLLVFCEHSIFLVSRPSAPRRSEKAQPLPPLQQIRVKHAMRVVSASVVPPPQRSDPLRWVDVVFATAQGSVYRLHMQPTDNWSVATMRMQRLSTTCVPTSPHGVRAYTDGLVILASAMGDSLLCHHDPWRELHRWPSAAPMLDVLPLDEANSGGPAQAMPLRMLTASGAGPTCSLRVLSHSATSQTLATLPLPGLLHVHALSFDGPADALVLVYTHESHIVSLHEGQVHTDCIWPARVLDAVAMEHACIFATSEALHILDAPTLAERHVHAWMPSQGTIVACALLPTGHAVVGLSTRMVLALVYMRDGWHEQARWTMDDDVVCVARHADRIAVGLWSRDVHTLSLDNASAQTLSVPALPTSLCLLATPSPYVVIGLASGHVALGSKESASLVHLWDLHAYTSPSAVHVRCIELPSSMRADTIAVLVTGTMPTLLYVHHGLWHASAWPVGPLYAAACIAADVAALTLACVTPSGLAFHALLSVAEAHSTCIPLGVHQPTALVRVNPHRIAASTWPSHRAEFVMGEVRGAIRLFATETWDRTAVYHLHVNERPQAMTCVTVHGQRILVVGTAYVLPDQPTSTSGRLLLMPCEAYGAAWTPTYALDVPGAVHGLAFVRGFLVAAVHTRVHTYAITPDSLAVRAQWGCAYLASCLVASGTNIVLGDAMHSMTILDVDDEGELHECARDMDPYWTTAVAAYNPAQQQYVGADIAMNVFLAERVTYEAKAPMPSPWSHVMRRSASFHYGDLVNKFVFDGTKVFLATASGAVGCLRPIPADLIASLACTQQAILRTRTLPGHIRWTTWRTLRTETHTAPPTGLVDGEIVRTLLDVDEATRSALWAAMEREAEQHTPPLLIHREKILAWLSTVLGEQPLVNVPRSHMLE
ncbi:uv-damaged dna-binding protein [Malassezia pachydermatis]|uniref:DNA damage-binding protein 1 n=1 Tax=Malassezia pachydermatis TaxID=77020 RepID=A0A0N0RSK7_9BASI|nr:uv-damaged dna-binding protein [Malassezia pachydermatis]KOS15779.1 uv-damaged dna-binding protein [Malassezia pachydermatis]